MKSRHLFIIGGTPLKGEVRVAGAKNAATKELVASLLTSESVTLTNVPNIGDVEVTLAMLKHLGAKVVRTGGRLTVHAPNLKKL